LGLVVIGTVLWGLWQVDLPLTRFLRSVQLPWLEVVGNVGNRLGSGWVLAGISGVLLAIGLSLKWPTGHRAGLEGLIAHGAVALVVQGLKHLIGRPRPRLMHGGGFQFGPSLDSGLDSFPSGHVTASFAVAAVLARHFPKAAWLVYGAAGLVAVSRVVRGSHFPTDVAGGMVLGVVAGSMVANFHRGWWPSLVSALGGLSPYLVAWFSLVWIAVHSAPAEPLNTMMVGAGTLLIAIGLGSRLYVLQKSEALRPAVAMPSAFASRSRFGRRRLAGQSPGAYGGRGRLAPLASRLLSWVGLAATSGSVTVIVLAVLAGASRVSADWQPWPGPECPPPAPQSEPPAALGLRAGLVEGAFVLWLALAAAILQGLKGILPIL
jgi:undecaprenyl-diphosphatase